MQHIQKLIKDFQSSNNVTLQENAAEVTIAVSCML